MPGLGAVHIGTSGWHYRHWRGLFYPEKLPASKMLEYYTAHFDTVEVNNSFYHLPPESSSFRPDGRSMAPAWKSL
jgi:uncharacterized protein YecE (DUF72 family)